MASKQLSENKAASCIKTQNEEKQFFVINLTVMKYLTWQNNIHIFNEKWTEKLALQLKTIPRPSILYMIRADSGEG